MQYMRVYAPVDLDAIVFNLESMRKNIDRETGMLGVIKADAYGHGSGGFAVRPDAAADAAPSVGFLAGRGDAVLPPAVPPCGDTGVLGEKSRRFPEKNLSFSPRLRYNKEKGTALPPSERGRRPWRRRRNHAKSGTIPCWSWYWPC